MKCLKICGRLETGQFIDEGFSHIVSIGDHDDLFDDIQLPKVRPKNHLCLRFSDTEDSSRSDAPTSADLGTLFEWLAGRHIERLLVHCTAGIGRSPAVALLSLSALNSEESPSIHMARVAESSECAYIWPNRLIVELGDQFLGKQGRILAALDAWRREKEGRK